MLDAAILRCSQDRVARKTDAECANARRAADAIAAREEEAKRQELEAESERKRDALRQQRERQQQRVAAAEEQAKIEREAQMAAQLTGDSSYAVETTGTLPASTPPGISVGSDSGNTGLRATQPIQPDVCRLDPAGMSDQDLISAYNAFQVEIERRQAASQPPPVAAPPPDDPPVNGGESADLGNESGG